MKKISAPFLLLLYSLLAQSQEYSPRFFQGYEEDVSGMRFGYHSPLPSVKKSLLVRGQSNYDPIVWKGEIVPKNYKNDFVHYIWMFGMDVTPDPVEFQLNINNVPYISFSSSQQSMLDDLKFVGKGGAELQLNVTMLDNTGDQMGFAVLKIPVKAVDKGKPTQFKISAVPEDNPAWFMTFKTVVKEKIDIYQNKVVAKEDGKLLHSISLDFMHIGADASTSILIAGATTKTVLKAGFSKLEINLPKVTVPTEYSAEIKIEGREVIQKKFTLSPVKEWKIYLVQHTQE